MKVVIAPDSFKESLAAPEVAEAIAQGVLAVAPDATVDLCPMADGGEGTTDAMVAATGGSFLYADVYDPLGKPIRARLGLLGEANQPVLPGELGVSAARARSGTGDGNAGTAVIEMAAASGLALVPPDLRDPLRTTTFGTGLLMLAALDAGVREIIVALGGSATVDGGSGCVQAMGGVFTDADGAPLVCGLAGGGLADLHAIDLSQLDPRLANVRVRAACDVMNPLLGEHGAAAVYAPQKGATPDAVLVLEQNLARFARVMVESLERNVADLPGAGAAGGMGAGLAGLLGASLERGGELVAETVGLARRLHGADLCITGEGCLDTSTRYGKTAMTVADFARIASVPCVCIPGRSASDAPAESFAAVRPLVDGNVSTRMAMEQPELLLKQRATEAVRTMGLPGKS
ncbi:MAG: glycerate kinase [Phycisphaerae bacterium]